MNVTNIYLSKHEDVKELAERIGTDIGSLELLTTENKKNVVVAINELKSIMSSVENNLGDYSTKQELTQAITDLINGADADSDTLKELADKITTLAQADNGLVSASSEQIFDSVQKEIARKNIDAVSTTDLNTVVDTLNNTHTKRSELEQAKTELSDSIEAKSSQLLGVITAEEATRKVEDEAIRGELALTNGKIQEAIDAIPEVDLTPFATKVELTRAITDLINGADVDSDTLKELADKITALAQTDKGLVNVTVAQEFTAEQKTQARSNIDAVSTTELNTAVGTLSNTHAKRSELEQAKTDLSDSIEAKSSQLLIAITAEEATRKAEDEAIRSELTLTDEKIQEAIDAIPEVDLTPFATKVELTRAITDLINGADVDSDTLKEWADKITALAQADNGLVSATEAQEFTVEQKTQARSNINAVSTNELETQKEDLLEDIVATVKPLATKVDLEAKAEKAPEGDEYALVSSLASLVAPYATKVDLTQAIADLINGDDTDSDALKELADEITALAQSDNGLVSATSAQEFEEANKEIARKNIDAVSKATFEQAVATISSTKANQDELSQAKTDLTSSIKTKSEELQAAISAEEDARTAEDVAIRSEFTQAHQELQEAVEVADTAIRSEFALADQNLREVIKENINVKDAAIRNDFVEADQMLEEAIKSEEVARKAENIAIRSELAEADQGLQTAVDAEVAERKAEDTAIRSEFTQAHQELQESVDAEGGARKAEGVAIRSEFANADQELQEAVDAEVAERKAEDTAIRGEFAQADQELQEAVDAEVAERKAEDTAIRGEFAQADQLLQESITTEEEARKAEDVAIRSEFAQADQALRQEVDVADEAIRGEVAKVNQQLQEAINAEQVARQEADTTINEQIDTKADKAPEGQEYALVSAIPDLTPYATKVELTRAITDLINGADVDSDTLKELADKITALAQADNGLVSATEAQSFSESNKEIARGNIDAVSTTTFDEAVATINSTKATHEELEQAKTELADSIQSNAEELEQAKTELADSIQSNAEELEQAKTELADSIQSNAEELLEAISTEEGARKAESESIRGELAETDQKIKDAIESIPEPDLTPYATKAEVAEDIGDIANLPTNDKTSVVASISELFSGVNHSVSELGNTIDEHFALKSELTPLATKVELTRAITDLINGADADSDTLKELADKITALAQADSGLVNALEPQDFNETQKQQARDNIDAAAKSDIPDVSGLATKAESDTKYHNKTVTYTRTEMDGRYPLKTASYTKAESDAKYPLKAASYTKAEGDARYYTKTQSDANYHNKTVTYTRTEMDNRYPLKAASYTKAQSDANYYTKTQSDANYHKKTVTYTRTEMDARYPLKAASYTKSESDGRYAKVWSGTQAQYNAITTKDAKTIYMIT